MFISLSPHFTYQTKMSTQVKCIILNSLHFILILNALKFKF